MKPLVIIGAGGLGKEMAVMVRHINVHTPSWELLGFYDDEPYTSNVVGIPMLGKIEDIITHLQRTQFAVLIAIGDPSVKFQIYQRLCNTDVYFPSFVHPSVTWGENIRMGKGCLVAAGCRLTVDITLGDFVLLNLNTTVGHDVKINSFTSVMPGVHVSGHVNISNEVLIGTGASVLQQLSIGEKSIVGAGAVVTKSLPSKSIYVGVPAKPMLR